MVALSKANDQCEMQDNRGSAGAPHYELAACGVPSMMRLK